MRILHIVPGLMTGGQETMLINIANEQAKYHNVVILIINDDYDDNLVKLFDPSVRIVYINRPRSSKNPWYFIKLNLTIWRLNSDVIHSHYEKIVQYLVPGRYKFVYTVHGFTISPYYLRKNKNLIAISKGIQKDVKDRASVVSSVIYNGIKIASIKKSKIPAGYTKNVPFRIVQVSRLFHNIKGQDILIRAIALLRDKGYDNISLDLIGDGDSKEYLRHLISELKINNVRLLGTKSVEYIYENLCKYNLFVQASRYEGFGLAVAEAMAAKVPVLISNCEGLMEVVNEGEYSLVFKNGSAEDCAAKIEAILKTPAEVLNQRVESAWNYVNGNFNVEVTASNYIKFYNKCE